jgi:predicted HAD superfamily phosphohydrolase YqeG
VIGDQLFTDIVFANRLGGYGILVQPLDPDSDSILKIPQREIERALLKWFGFGSLLA